MSGICALFHWVPNGCQLHPICLMKINYHAGIKRTFLGRRPDVLLICVIQVWRRDFNFGYTDDILGCEWLKLNVLSIWSVVIRRFCSGSLAFSLVRLKRHSSCRSDLVPRIPWWRCIWLESGGFWVQGDRTSNLGFRCPSTCWSGSQSD